MKGNTGQAGYIASRTARRIRRLIFFGGLLALTAYNLHGLIQSMESPHVLTFQRKLITAAVLGSENAQSSSSTAQADPTQHARDQKSLELEAEAGTGGIAAGGGVGPRDSNKGTEERQCHTEAHAEYDGDVVLWGANNLQTTAAACCQSCRDKGGCKSWVWCGEVGGCTADRKHKECWLKSHKGAMDLKRPQGKRGSGVTWTSGSLYTEIEAKASLLAFDAVEAKEAARLARLKDNKALPLVFLDVEIKGKAVGRMEFVLFTDISPRSAENFRQLCTGEAGVVPTGDGKKREGAGKPYHYKGRFFYRIIDRFIDQTGAETESVFGGQYKDDRAGLKLQHDRKGLLSMANMGPDTNTAHFSIMQAPAHHLDTHYTIFGELVSGWHVAEAINVLSRGKKDNTAGPEEGAKIVDSGQIRKGTLVPDLNKP